MGETENAQRADGYRRNRLGDTRALLMNTGWDTGNLYNESVGAGLLAMNDDAVYLNDRSVCIAGKPAPTGHVA
jgi:hypothetical protein